MRAKLNEEDVKLPKKPLSKIDGRVLYDGSANDEG